MITLQFPLPQIPWVPPPQGTDGKCSSSDSHYSLSNPPRSDSMSTTNQVTDSKYSYSDSYDVHHTIFCGRRRYYVCFVFLALYRSHAFLAKFCNDHQTCFFTRYRQRPRSCLSLGLDTCLIENLLHKNRRGHTHLDKIPKSVIYFHDCIGQAKVERAVYERGGSNINLAW